MGCSPSTAVTVHTNTAVLGDLEKDIQKDKSGIMVEVQKFIAKDKDKPDGRPDKVNGKVKIKNKFGFKKTKKAPAATRRVTMHKSDSWTGEPQVLSDDQKYLVAKSMHKLRPKMTDMGIQVFKTIFAMRPDLKEHFGFKDLPDESLEFNAEFRTHAARFMAMVTCAIESIENGSNKANALFTRVGAQHLHIKGFQRGNFSIFKIALLHCMALQFGKEFKGELYRAWEAVIKFVIMKLQNGYQHAKAAQQDSQLPPVNEGDPSRQPKVCPVGGDNDDSQPRVCPMGGDDEDSQLRVCLLGGDDDHSQQQQQQQYPNACPYASQGDQHQQVEVRLVVENGQARTCPTSCERQQRRSLPPKENPAETSGQSLESGSDCLNTPQAPAGRPYRAGGEEVDGQGRRLAAERKNTRRDDVTTCNVDEYGYDDEKKNGVTLETEAHNAEGDSADHAEDDQGEGDDDGFLPEARGSSVSRVTQSPDMTLTFESSRRSVSMTTEMGDSLVSWRSVNDAQTKGFDAIVIQ